MSRRKSLGNSSGSASGLPQLERFQLEGREEPGIRRKSFEQQNSLHSVVRKGLLAKTGLMPLNSQMGVYALNLPHFSTEVWKLMYKQIKAYVSDYNSENRKWFFELYPQLLLVDGISAMDDESPSDALTQFVHQYIEDVTELIAAFSVAAVWLNVDGGNEASARITARLKPSAMRTLATKIGTLPCVEHIKDYVLNATKILRYDSPDETINVFLPLWLRPGQTYIDDLPRILKPDWSVLALSDADRFGPLIPFHQIGNSTGMTWDSAGKTRMGFANKEGLVADSIYDWVDSCVYRVVTRYRDTMKAPDSQIARFFVSDFQLLTGTVSYDEIVRKVVDNPICSALDFAKTHMQYFDLPSPVMLRQGVQHIAGVVNPFTSDAGVETVFTYRASELLNTIAETADDYISDLTTANGVVANGDINRFGNTMGLVTLDPDELAKLRSFSQTGSGEKTEVGSYDRFYSKINFDWTKWKFLGFDDTMGQVDGLIEAATAKPSLGQFSIELATGVEPPTKTNLYVGHTGLYPILINFMKMFSSQMVTYTGKPGQTVSDLLALTGDKGHWQLNIEEVERGILRPYYVVTPLVNNHDYAQCGFYHLISANDLVDESGIRQPNRWSQWARYGLLTGTTLSANRVKNHWAVDDDRALIKDAMVFIGDSLGLTPESHFSRLDIAPAITTSEPKSSVFYPIKPFVNRSLSSFRLPRYVDTVEGISEDQTNGTVSVIPNDCIVVADSIISLTLREINWKFVAWAFWMPDLMFDEDHPIPETLFAYIEEGAKRMDSALNGKGFLDVMSMLTLTTISTMSLDESIRRVLKISPKFSKSNLPASFNPKSRPSFASKKMDSPRKSFSKRPPKVWDKPKFSTKSEIESEGLSSFETSKSAAKDPKSKTPMAGATSEFSSLT